MGKYYIMTVQNLYKPAPIVCSLQNKRLWTQKFGLGISFSASLSAFPSSRLNPSAFWCGILSSLGCPRISVFFFLEVPLRLVLMMRRRPRKRVVLMCGRFYILVLHCHTYCSSLSILPFRYGIDFSLMLDLANNPILGFIFLYHRPPDIIWTIPCPSGPVFHFLLFFNKEHCSYGSKLCLANDIYW